MVERQEIIERIDYESPSAMLNLNAEGNFHLILGTKDEHDGIKVYAANPQMVEKLLNDDAFSPDQYYATWAENGEGVKFDPGELDEHIESVSSIGAVDGMLPYDRVSVLTSGEEIDIESMVNSN